MIAVPENRNITRNDVRSLPGKAGQFHIVDNTGKPSVGIVAAIGAGIAPESVRRPMAGATVVVYSLKQIEEPASSC